MSWKNRSAWTIREYLTVLVCSFILAGCGTTPRAPSSRSSSTPVAAKSKSPSSLPAAGSGRGGYYLDDGPLEQIPDGLYETPNAEPKIEPYARAPNRPYVVFGKKYVPITDNRPYKEQGYGSWYGKKFHGKKTSSGEPYDMFKMTAAHPTLPIPSYVRITNLKTDAQVIVRINDRGPFHSDRIIDLSYTAALKLGYLNKGSGQVEVEHLLPDEIRRLAQAGGTQTAITNNSPEKAVALPDEWQVKNKGTTQPVTSVIPITLNESNKRLREGYYLQLGAYQNPINAESNQAQLALNWAHILPSVKIVQNGIYYRLFAGPFDSIAQATNIAEKIQQDVGMAKPLIVKR